jgi:hypothetical protein
VVGISIDRAGLVKQFDAARQRASPIAVRPTKNRPLLSLPDVTLRLIRAFVMAKLLHLV